MFNWYWIVIGISVIGMALLVFGIYARMKDDWEIDGTARIALGAVLLCVAAFSGLLCFSARLDAKRNVEMYRLKSEYVMQVIDNSDKYQFANVEITQTILEYNEWLNEAQAAKAAMGKWSAYYDLPVEELQYIGIKEDKK